MLPYRAVPNVYQFKDFAGSSHRILIEMIRRSGVRGRLLDLGAAGGELSEALRDRFDYALAFEFDVGRIPQLRRRFDHSVISDLERIQTLPKGFDAIILADVIEHLREPRSLLPLARAALNPGGRLFLSVPNIANVTIRLGLLFGYFIYRDRGILDSTHLRFYTMRSIREEIESAGFRIEEIKGSSVPIRIIVGDWMPVPLVELGEWILSWLTQSWKALFAYQFVMVAVPLPDSSASAPIRDN